MTKVNKSRQSQKVKTKLDISLKLIINVIIISVLFFGAIFLFSMATNINVEEKNIKYTFKDKSEVTYDVLIKPNQFYTTNTLGMDQLYPASIIDKINIKYKYNFETDKPTSYTYRYFTTATLLINSKNDKKNNQLLKNTYQLESNVLGTEIAKNNYNLEKEYIIDYNHYNNIVNNYKTTFNLDVDANLKVSMYIQIIDKYKDSVINESKTIDVVIPLNSNPVEITRTIPEEANIAIVKEINSVTNSKFFIIVATIMLITSILLFVQEIKKVMKHDKEQSKYLTELNKILVPNSEIIVKVKNKINLKNSNIIEVETINALLDAQNELRIPIAYFETKKNKEGCFVIVNGKEAWRYMFKIEDEK